MSVLADNRSSASSNRLAETTTGTARPLLCFVYSPTSGPSRRAEGFLAQVLQRRKNHQTFVVQRVNGVDGRIGEEARRDRPAMVVVETGG